MITSYGLYTTEDIEKITDLDEVELLVIQVALSTYLSALYKMHKRDGDCAGKIAGTIALRTKIVALKKYMKKGRP